MTIDVTKKIESSEEWKTVKRCEGLAMLWYPDSSIVTTYGDMLPRNGARVERCKSNGSRSTLRAKVMLHCLGTDGDL